MCVMGDFSNRAHVRELLVCDVGPIKAESCCLQAIQKTLAMGLLRSLHEQQARERIVACCSSEQWAVTQVLCLRHSCALAISGCAAPYTVGHRPALSPGFGKTDV